MQKYFRLVFLKRKDLDCVICEACNHKFCAHSALRNITDVNAFDVDVEELSLDLVEQSSVIV